MAAKFAIVALLVSAALAWSQVEASLDAQLSATLDTELAFIKAAQKEARAAARALREGSHCLKDPGDYACTLNKLAPEIELFLAAYDAAYAPMIEAIKRLKRGQTELAADESAQDLLVQLYGQVLIESAKHKSALFHLLPLDGNNGEVKTSNVAIGRMAKKLEVVLLDKYLQIGA